MTETTRSPECSASTLYLAFELGSTKWTLAFTPSAGAAAADSIAAGGRSEWVAA